MRKCNKNYNGVTKMDAITRVVYINGYKDTSGIDFLEGAGIKLTQIEHLDE